ncbi:glycosyltransferase family 2 protein [Marivita sp. S2033]
MELIFWVSAIVLFYSFVGYGLILLIISRLHRTPTAPDNWAPQKVSFLIAAYNEAGLITEKLANTVSLDSHGAEVEIVVVSDGSTDGTADVARAFGDPRVTVLEPGRVGKAEALGLGLEHCTGDVVIFSDANAILAEGTLIALLRHFSDPDVGGVCGQITVEGADGKTGGIGFSEGLFWNYDQALKTAESRVGGAVSAQGSVYAMRRALAATPAPGCTDDFMISVQAVRAGKRLVFEPDARTTEIVTENVSSEMRRRVRSSERGWRSLMTSAGLMNPFQHGWYAWQLISHKLIRRLNPLFLILLFISNLALVGHGWFYTVLALCQIAFYALAAAALAKPSFRRFKPASIASFFVLAHVAMAWGFYRYATGRRSVLWTPSREGT